MAMIIFPQVKRAVRINDVVYGYRMNQSGSTAQVKKSVKSVDSYWIVEQLLKDLATMNIPVTNEIYQQLLHQGQLCYLRNQNQPKDIQEALFILFSDLLKRNYTRIEANDSWLLKLEQSLLTCNYTQYRLVCTLME
ncbi:MAG: hypothetical protein IJW77_11970 [Clostridia bacterium]|nr:hypothetical protein [Clostridia bacterium]